MNASGSFLSLPQFPEDFRIQDIEKFLTMKSTYEAKIEDQKHTIEDLEQDKKDLKSKIQDMERSLRNCRKRELKAEQKALEFFET